MSGLLASSEGYRTSLLGWTVFLLQIKHTEGQSMAETFFFLPVLLRYNGLKALYKFEYSIYIYITK